MPRRRRIEVPGSLHHVMAHGIEGLDVFRNSQDCHLFLSLFGNYLAAFDNRCYAWALMPNHYHLLVRTSAANLGMMMRGLNGAYARRYNKKYQRRGYLFMDRYKSIATQELAYLKELIAYIHLNPVRAGMVKSPASLAAYPWTSHVDYVRPRRHPWLRAGEGLRRFSLRKGQRIRAYMAFLTARCDPSRSAVAMPPFVEADIDDRVMGDPEFVRAALKLDRDRRARQAGLRKQGITMGHIAEQVSAALGVPVPAMRRESRQTPAARARAVAAHVARKELSLPLCEIADYLGLTVPAASLAAKRGRAIAEMEELNIKI